MGLPILFKNVVNFLSNPNAFSHVLISFLLLAYSSCWIFDHFITQIRNLLVYILFERSVKTLSLAIVDHLLKLSLRFHMDKRTGALSSYLHRLQNGLSSVFWGISTFLLPIAIEMVLVISLISWLYGWIYSSALLVIMIGYSLLNLIGMKKLLKAQEVFNEKQALAGGKIVDSLLNYETIKYFNNEQYEHNHIRSVLEEQERSGIQRSKIDIYLQLAQATIIGFGFIYLNWLSGLAVCKGEMDIGDFVLINGYLMQFIMPLNHLGYMVSQIRKGILDIRSVFATFLIEPEVQDSPFAISLEKNKVEVRFEKVNFGYTSERSILKNISFVIPTAKRIGIVGYTGSGKSTLARLLFRFYDVDSGSIKINGHDIRSISQHSLHEIIGVVPQDTVLFNDSIKYNIAYGNPKASDEEIEYVASLAQLGQFIDTLPDGYQTQVGERGLKLSGGEKQRIGIARVLLKKPSLFIFDEATSSLDTITEREIQKNLNEISEGITTIIIAHRLSTVIHVDEILVLDDGAIIEKGNHNQLLKQNGIYSQLWKQQHNQTETTSSTEIESETCHLEVQRSI